VDVESCSSPPITTYTLSDSINWTNAGMSTASISAFGEWDIWAAFNATATSGCGTGGYVVEIYDIGTGTALRSALIETVPCGDTKAGDLYWHVSAAGPISVKLRFKTKRSGDVIILTNIICCVRKK
jgi:hypothetical protein